MNDVYPLIFNFLFILGVLLLPVGIGFMLIPGKIFKFGIKMNRWVSTESFFNKINTPIYKERFFYRHNKILGAFIVFASVFCLYILTFDAGEKNVSIILNRLAESSAEAWMFIILFYMLVIAIILALVFGVIMFIRPSALKSIEKIGNRWIDTDVLLKALDESKDLPDKILPGNPRIFGFVVTLGAIYIIWSTYSF